MAEGAAEQNCSPHGGKETEQRNKVKEEGARDQM